MSVSKAKDHIRTTTAEIVHEGVSMIVAVQWTFTIVGLPALSSVYDGKRDITGQMNSESYNRCVAAMREAASNEQIRGGVA